MGLAHNFTRNNILSYVRTFYGLTTSKQCDLHLQTSFLGACLMFIEQFGYGPGSGPTHASVCVPALSWNISRSRIFPNKLLIQTDREKYRECRKIVIWISHCFWLPCWFSPNFFFTFFKLEIFWEFSKMTFQGIKLNYFFGIYVFFCMYLTYKNQSWDHFSCFFGRCIYSTVWTRNGSKIDFRLLVFKGLIAFPGLLLLGLIAPLEQSQRAD